MAVYIDEVGMSKFGKRTESLQELIFEATKEPLKNTKKKIDAIFIGNQNVEEFCDESNFSSQITDYLNLTPLPSFRIDTASSSGAGVFHSAFLSVASGIYKNVLVIGGEKMTHLQTPLAIRILSKVLSEEEKFFGGNMSALAGLITRAYMEKFNVSREDLSLVAVKSHSNAMKNPYAHFQKEISIEDVLKSKVVSSPLRVYDCSPISDGACSLILTSGKTDIEVAGLGHSTEFISITHRDDLTKMNATINAGKKAFAMAKLSPKDINIAEIHDAFTTFEIIGSEDLGFFKKGQGMNALKEGKTSLSGELPINTSGGLKARGHPLGASGLAQIIELVWQLRNQAEKRQVKAKIGMALSIGGLASNNLATIVRSC